MPVPEPIPDGGQVRSGGRGRRLQIARQPLGRGRTGNPQGMLDGLVEVGHGDLGGWNPGAKKVGPLEFEVGNIDFLIGTGFSRKAGEAAVGIVLEVLEPLGQGLNPVAVAVVEVTKAFGFQCAYGSRRPDAIECRRHQRRVFKMHSRSACAEGLSTRSRF